MSRAASSARLGVTLRKLLADPATGFAAALSNADRREQLGRRPSEGFAPILFAAVGGAGMILAWLKFGTLVGLRHSHAGHRVWVYVLVTALIGAVIGVVALALWGLVGPWLLRSLSDHVTPRDLRIIGGLSGVPQLFALIVLLPIDAVLSGPATFTSQRMPTPVAEVWAAVSVAVAAGLAVWSAVLLIRGVQDVTGARLLQATGVGAVAICCLVVVTVGLLAGAVALSGIA